MRVETFVPVDNWKNTAATAKAVEAAGFDSIATPEITNDPFVTMAVAAQATEKVALRTAIVVAFPRSPMVVANSAWELHANSGGRFCLGLGTQVKGHNERRFSVPWAKPRTRLREYVESLRAIWSCWQNGEKLQYSGEFYNFSLMTPEFSHRPNDLGPIPVYTAAVRPRMMELAGQVADGVRLHGFCTRRYLDEVALPTLEKGLAETGRTRESFEVCDGGFIATGPDEESLRTQMDFIRYRIAFYGSTRTYAPVLELHGWGDLNAKLHAMSKAGQWKQMAAEISDDVVRTFAACATFDNLASAIEERFGGLSDSISIGFGDHAKADLPPGLIQDIQRIPTRFEAHTPR